MLRHFVARFNTATLEVRDLNEDMAISAMKRGLRASRFTYSLDKTLPRTYAELLERAYKYMRTDEGASDRCLAEPEARRRSRGKVGNPPNQAGSRPIVESRHPDESKNHPDNRLQGRHAPGMTPTLLSPLLVRRF